MTEIRINQKFYKNLELLTISKLEHIRQLAQIEVDNYEPFLKTAPPKRKKICEGFMQRLKLAVTTVNNVIKAKREEVPFPSQSEK